VEQNSQSIYNYPVSINYLSHEPRNWYVRRQLQPQNSNVNVCRVEADQPPVSNTNTKY